MNTQKEMLLLWMPEYLGSHAMAWRQDDRLRSLEMDFDLIRRQVQLAERGKFHGALFADTLAVGYYATEMTVTALSRTAKGSRWEPITLLSALAACTQHIGLLGTASAIYFEPYNVARMLASLDHVSGGRAGWSIDTNAYHRVDLNFGGDKRTDDVSLRERSEEFFDVVSGLWDSWEDDAFVRDKTSGSYFDPEKLHVLNHSGKYLSVAGPLNIARPLQGHPVIVQTGHAAHEMGVRHADVICTWSPEIAIGKELYGNLKAKAAEQGRNPDHVKILPALILSVGRDRAHAEEKIARLDALVDPVFGLELLEGAIGADLSGHALDGPVPHLPEMPNSPSGAREYYLDIARRDNLSIRQLMQVIARVSVVPGSAMDIADMMQAWFEADAADGFAITFDNDEESLEIFVDSVVPELQRRRLFQREYRGTTLRENLGLPRPANRLAPAR